jgi:hypothetical protein
MCQNLVLCATLAIGFYHIRFTFFEGRGLPGPTLTFGFIVATLFGAGFHLILGGDVRRLAIFLVAGWLGFAMGHLAGVSLEVRFMNVGVLRLLPACCGALIVLIFAQAITSTREIRRRGQ